MPFEGIILACVVAVLLFALVITLVSRYKKCPSDRVMVIYGKVGSNKDGTSKSARCIHGGAAFIWPVVQSYEFLDLTPLSISVDLENALSRQNIRINVPSRFTVGISTEPGVMQNAAERLLGLKLQEIQELAKDIIFGQLRLVIATMDIEEINTDRDKFLEAVSRNVEGELKKIGLRLINVAISTPWARRPPPRPSTTPRRTWPSATATAPSARPRPTGTSGSRWPRRTPWPSRARTPPRWTWPCPTPSAARRRPRPPASPQPPRRSPRLRRWKRLTPRRKSR